MGTYLVLDGHSLAYRAWFALAESGLQTSSGQQTHAVYGFVSMTTRLLQDFSPDGMAVAFDRPEPTFRDAIADDYKAGREEMPEPLSQQIELIRRFVEALGIAALDAEGFEADDVLATLATQLDAAGEDVVVVTGDRDAFQLVADPHVKVLYNRRGVTDYVLYDEEGILERTGVRPPAYPLLAALRGDPSDNLPGVPGVGEKTAAKLVNAYGDVEGIYAHLDECTPKLRESLQAHEAQVRKNLLLIPAVRDVPLGVDAGNLALGRGDREELGRLFDFLEMRTPRDRLFAALDALSLGSGPAPAPSETPGESIEVRVLDADAPAFLTALDASGSAFALEPVWASQPGRSALVGVALGAMSADGTLPEGAAWLAGELVGEITGELSRLLGARPRPRLVGHRLKEFVRALGDAGVDVTGLDLDTAVAAYLLDASDGAVSLEELARRAGVGAGAAPAATTTAGSQLGFDLDPVAPGAVAELAATRAALAAAAAPGLRARLVETGAVALYDDVERPLVRVLARMERVGIAVDVERLRRIGAELTAETRVLEARIQELAGETFNVNSTTQLRSVLYDKLGLAPQRKTKTGYSTDAQTLERLRGEHPIVETLLRYREIEKLRSTYGEGLLAEVAPDGRIHATFNQTVARTGRLSSDQPNLHNIPVRSDDGRRFREAFVAADGFELLVADYNQIELRVIAHLAGDPGLTAAFAEGRDIHTATAAGVFGVEPSAVTREQRARAKMVSYGLAYGMEAYGLAQRLNIAVPEAQEILEAYFAAFPAVRRYMDETVVTAKRNGYTETLLGRRRYLPELASDNFRVRQAAERQAMNSGIQGLAADIFKVALVRLDAALEALGGRSRLVLQVHDEVLVEVASDERDEVGACTLGSMRDAFPLSVPLEVHAAWGRTWADAKPG